MTCRDLMKVLENKLLCFVFYPHIHNRRGLSAQQITVNLLVQIAEACKQTAYTVTQT